mmetsp:Transcript_20624/g.48406  ORF Transcript_20624/g.48406 Transcript_20624/m.48406 type:complete len:1424 (-) Transcript_20624:31-4302(-)
MSSRRASGSSAYARLQDEAPKPKTAADYLRGMQRVRKRDELEELAAKPEVQTAIVMIQRIWRTRVHMLQRFAPFFFSQRDGLPASFGSVKFGGAHSRSVRAGMAEWVRLASEEFAEPQRVLLLLERFWKLKTPNLIISVTGAAKNLQIEHQLAKKFAQGLSSVLKSTEAWVITGGTQTGVMDLVGSAMDEYAVTSPLIGICPWQVVRDKENLQAQHDAGMPIANYIPGEARHSTMSFATREFSIDETVSLQPNHDYFIFVDQPLNDTAYDADPTKVRFGADIAPRANLEDAAVQFRSVPTVLLVVSGGAGTFDQVLGAVRQGCPVVLVARSGQVADALHAVHIELRHRLGSGSGGGGAAEFAKEVEKAAEACTANPVFLAWLDSFRNTEAQRAQILQRLKGLCQVVGRESQLLRSFDFSPAGGGAALDVVLLEAILDDKRPALCAESRFEFKMQRLCAALHAKGQDVRAAEIASILRNRVRKISSRPKQLAKHLKLACEWRRVDICAKLTKKIMEWTQESGTSAAEKARRRKEARSMARDAAQAALAAGDVPLVKHLLTGEQVPFLKASMLDLISLYDGPHRFGLFKHNRQLMDSIDALRRRNFEFSLDLEASEEVLAEKYNEYARGYQEAIAPFYADYDPLIAAFVGRARHCTAAHCFLWAVVMAETSIAELFLDKCKQPLNMCLAGARLCVSLAEAPDMEGEAYLEIKVRLEDTALELIDRAADAGRDVAYRMLVRGSPAFGGLCPLELAVDMGVISFQAHRTVQAIVAGEWWRGKYPGSRLAIGPSAAWWSVLLENWVPFVQFLDTAEVHTDEIGVCRLASDCKQEGGNFHRLANVHQMRAAVQILATQGAGGKAFQALRLPIERRITASELRRQGVPSPRVLALGVAGLKERGNVELAQKAATDFAREEVEAMRREDPSSVGRGFQTPSVLWSALRRMRFLHLMHVPYVKFMTRYLVYVFYLSCFLVVVKHPGRKDVTHTTTMTMRLLLSPREEFARIYSLEPGDEGYSEPNPREMQFAIFSLCLFIDEVWQLIMSITCNQITGRPITVSYINAIDWLVYPLVVLSTAARYTLPGLGHAHAFLMSLLVYLSTIRVLEFASYYKPVGLLMNTFLKMTVDVGIWLLLLMIFAVAATFTYHGLFADEYETNTEINSILFELFSNRNPTIWSMFGEYPIDDNLCTLDFDDEGGFFNSRHRLGACMVETVTVWGNVLIMQIILVNLLIAMMSETYSLSTQSAHVESRSHQVKRTFDYISNYFVVPPPLNAPFLCVLIPLWASQMAWHRFCCHPPVDGKPRPTVASRLLTTLATQHSSRDDVLFLSDMRKAQPALMRRGQQLVGPDLLFERMSSSQRHWYTLNGLETVRNEVEQVGRAVAANFARLARARVADAAATPAGGGDSRAGTPRAIRPGDNSAPDQPVD